MTIALTLGYPEGTPDPTLGPQSLETTNRLLTELETIDQQIADARRDSMAEEIDGMKVNFSAHIAELKADGSRLLRQIANVSGMALKFDRYTGRYVRGSNTSPFVVLG